MAARVRHARFNGYVCIVKTCGNVEHKHNLCRTHWQQVPYSDRIQIMVDAITAARKAARKGDVMAAKWARHYEAGMRAGVPRRMTG